MTMSDAQYQHEISEDQRKQEAKERAEWSPDARTASHEELLQYAANRAMTVQLESDFPSGCGAHIGRLEAFVIRLVCERDALNELIQRTYKRMDKS